MKSASRQILQFWPTAIIGATWLVTFLAATVSCHSIGTAQAQTEYRRAPSRISAQTVYLYDAIEGFHRIVIIGDLGGKGTLILNPSKCSTNEFGDPEVCTRIADTTVPITIKDTNKPDPAHLGRKLYSLEGTGLGNPLLLVVWSDLHRPARLIYNNRGPDAPRPITLEPLVYTTEADKTSRTSTSGAVVLCAGTYTAQQIPGSVIILATGLHPTAGYQTFFEELPITVYPPEFRLMHIKPVGPAAQIITPFFVHASFPAKDKVERVIIHDATGRHEVRVEQVPDVK
jgi:hypothetical protein